MITTRAMDNIPDGSISQTLTKPKCFRIDLATQKAIKEQKEKPKCPLCLPGLASMLLCITWLVHILPNIPTISTTLSYWVRQQVNFHRPHFSENTS